MNWNAIVDKVSPYVVKIETPRGHGTGFLCLYNQDKSLIGIATAWHVVSYAEEWQQPIRIRHQPSNTQVFLKESNRGILSDSDTDSAVILFPPGDLGIPKELIPLLPTSVALDIGTDIGWLGYPGLAANTLCFFSGSVSARRDHSYLIDGVAINGVSGGPVIYSNDTDGVQFVGTVSAYMSNRATGDVLPGLAIAQDVSHFHKMVSFIKSLDEAREQQQKAKSEEAKPASEPSLDEPPLAPEGPNTGQ